ncbi:MAG TPA: class II glutamine amidotransferase [Thermoplasmata archaeon]|nr:class II glutamine amidotransferase [Thermoplasmata archaeon]
MCRLFGLLGDESSGAEEWLVASDRSLLAQSHASRATLQNDGWGVGWYDGSRRPRIERGTRGAYQPKERPLFARAAENARGPVVVGHLRRASNPMKLPRGQLIAPENSQPFSDGASLFIHNGEISLPRETRPHLGPLDAEVQGVNDSEVLFWLFTKHLRASADPVRAYEATRRELAQVWEETGRIKKRPYSGLNVVYAPGPDRIWAFCHWLGDHGGALFAKDQPYYRMGYRATENSVIVGSEPFSSTDRAWEPLENGMFLMGERAGGAVRVRTGQIAEPEG